MSHNMEKYQYQIIRSNRKSICIQIKPEGMVVRAPKFMKNTDIERFLKKKESWIQKHYSKVREQQKKSDNMQPFMLEEVKQLKDRAAEVIPGKVRHYASLIGVDYGRITIRCQKTRWGSCTVKGNLNFNCLLMLAPEAVLDYVIVHELCHRKQMNHSKLFYEEVKKVLPEYKEQQKWLKENGTALLRRIL